MLFAAVAFGVSANPSAQATNAIAAPLRTNFLRFTGDPLQLGPIGMNESAEPFCNFDAPHSSRFLEGEVNSDLKLSRVAVRAANLTEVRIGQVRIRIRIMRCIGQVERIELHGYLHRLMDRLRFRQGKVRVVITRAMDQAEAGITKLQRRRRRKAAGVEPFRNRAEGADVRARNVGVIGYAASQIIIGGVEAERSARLEL